MHETTEPNMGVILSVLIAAEIVNQDCGYSSQDFMDICDNHIDEKTQRREERKQDWYRGQKKKSMYKRGWK